MRSATRSRGEARGPVNRRARVLIADDDTPFARRLSEYLWDHGYECKTASTISESKDIVEIWQPDSIFVDLMLPETNALSLCKFVTKQKLEKTPKIIVMSRQTLVQGIETMRRAGASHYLVKPFSLEDAVKAVETSPLARVASPNATPGGASVRELHLLNLFLKQAMSGGIDLNSNLFNLMRMISLKVHAVRCSFIQCLNADTGLVLASNDNENVQGLPISLAQYPEVREVLRTLKPLLIQNIRTSDILAPVQAKLASMGFETMAVFPVFCRGELYGVMSLRMEHKDKTELYYVEKFGQVCSQIISLAIATAN